jgi:predicted ThiF/HesA family dinucleotide-utilizing enzyme
MKTHGENDKSQVKIKEHNVSEHNVSEVKVEEPKVEQQKHDFQHNCGRSTFCEVALRMKKIIKDVNKEEKPLLKNDECCICLQGYNSNTTTTSVSCSCAHYPVEIINCGHTIHAGCYIALVNENKFGCPQCTVVPPQFFGSIFMK